MDPITDAVLRWPQTLEKVGKCFIVARLLLHAVAQIFNKGQRFRAYGTHCRYGHKIRTIQTVPKATRRGSIIKRLPKFDFHFYNLHTWKANGESKRYFCMNGFTFMHCQIVSLLLFLLYTYILQEHWLNTIYYLAYATHTNYLKFWSVH